MNVTVTELRRRLGHYLRLAKKGATVVVLEHAVPVAEIRAVPAGSDGDAHLRRLVRDGLVTPARRRPSTGWLDKPPVPCAADPVRALIDAR